MFQHSSGLVRLGLQGGRLTRDEENRAPGPFEKFCRHLTKEQLVARPRAYTHRQQIVTTDLELAENGFLRRLDAAHCASHRDPCRSIP